MSFAAPTSSCVPATLVRGSGDRARCEMSREREISEARQIVEAAERLLDDARMVGAPPDCVAERERDLAAARVRLAELERDDAQQRNSRR